MFLLSVYFIQYLFASIWDNGRMKAAAAAADEQRFSLPDNEVHNEEDKKKILSEK